MRKDSRNFEECCFFFGATCWNLNCLPRNGNLRKKEKRKNPWKNWQLWCNFFTKILKLHWIFFCLQVVKICPPKKLLDATVLKHAMISPNYSCQAHFWTFSSLHFEYPYVIRAETWQHRRCKTFFAPSLQHKLFHPYVFKECGTISKEICHNLENNGCKFQFRPLLITMHLNMSTKH